MAVARSRVRNPGHREPPPEGRPADLRSTVIAAGGRGGATGRFAGLASFAAISCVVGLALLSAAAASGAAPDEAEFAARREAMVREQVAGRGVDDPAVLKAMRTVRRHRFVPPGQVDGAYDDRPLPIGYGQTISQPYIVAAMTESIRPQPGYRVLEIGTGSGYQAAVLAEIVGKVFSIEIIPELGESAAARLRSLGYRNVEVKVGDGYAGWPEEAPFDAIVVTAAAESIPPPLIRQLREGGRMVIPSGASSFTQILTLVEKRGGEITTRQLMPVRFVPFRRAP